MQQPKPCVLLFDSQAWKLSVEICDKHKECNAFSVTVEDVGWVYTARATVEITQEKGIYVAYLRGIPEEQISFRGKKTPLYVTLLVDGAPCGPRVSFTPPVGLTWLKDTEEKEKEKEKEKEEEKDVKEPETLFLWCKECGKKGDGLVPGKLVVDDNEQKKIVVTCQKHNLRSEPLKEVKRNTRGTPCGGCSRSHEIVIQFSGCDDVACLDCFPKYCRYKLRAREFRLHPDHGYTIQCPRHHQPSPALPSPSPLALPPPPAPAPSSTTIVITHHYHPPPSSSPTIITHHHHPPSSSPPFFLVPSSLIPLPFFHFLPLSSSSSLFPSFPFLLLPDHATSKLLADGCRESVIESSALFHTMGDPLYSIWGRMGAALLTHQDSPDQWLVQVCTLPLEDSILGICDAIIPIQDQFNECPSCKRSVCALCWHEMHEGDCEIDAIHFDRTLQLPSLVGTIHLKRRNSRQHQQPTQIPMSF